MLPKNFFFFVCVCVCVCMCISSFFLGLISVLALCGALHGCFVRFDDIHNRWGGDLELVELSEAPRPPGGADGLLSSMVVQLSLPVLSQFHGGLVFLPEQPLTLLQTLERGKEGGREGGRERRIISRGSSGMSILYLHASCLGSFNSPDYCLHQVLCILHQHHISLRERGIEEK